MSEGRKRFRLRSPSRSTENWAVIPGMEHETAEEAKLWLKLIDWKRIHSFRFQVNYLPERKVRP